MASEAAAGKTLQEGVTDYIMHHVQDGTHWAVARWSTDFPQPFTLHFCMFLIAFALLSWLFIVKYKKQDKVPTGLTNVLETLVVFVRDEISIAYLGKEDGRKLAPLFCTFFFFILSLNLLGLVPIFSTATGNFTATLALASVVFFFMTVGAIAKNGPVGFFQAFVPHGVPIPVLLIIVPLELLGVLIKTGVLALRLFANLLAGHIVLFNLLGLVVVFGVAAAPALAIALFVFFLEILVSFLQAYISTMLSAMFIGQIYHPEH